MAPAKINLFLHILDRRADGYHNLQTAFQFLDLTDTLEFKLREDGKILRDDTEPDYGDSDLILKAANLLKSYGGLRLGATIKLEKNIPEGGGLGGGSSNAATTLVALNELWQTGLSQDELLTLGKNLGADVPIFIHGKSSIANGIGDEIEYMEFEQNSLIVVCPRVHVSTKEVFNAKQLTRNNKAMKIRSSQLAGLNNDFAPLVRKMYPEVNKVIEFLAKFGKPKLTGSGACVFMHLPNMHKVNEVLDIIPSGWRAYACNSLNISPLYLE